MHIDSDSLGALRDILLSPVARFFQPGAQTFWSSYVGAAIVAGLYYLWSRRNRKTTLKGLFRYLFPRKIVRSLSTRLDLKMYIMSSLFLALQAAVWFSGMKGLNEIFLKGLVYILGPGAKDHALGFGAVLFIPIVLYLALELGYWLSHYWLHHIDWLWELHKVHHSAEVMTPATEWRQHPVEYIFVPLVMGVISSAALAALKWGFGPDPTLAQFWSPSLILLVFVMTYLHLRHSHVNLTAPGILGYVFQSPAHHQIHHSTDPRHFDKNLGFCLSVWDFVFGTLYIPRKNETMTLGLFDEHGKKDELVTSGSLWRHMALPVERCFRKIPLIRSKPVRKPAKGNA